MLQAFNNHAFIDCSDPQGECQAGAFHPSCMHLAAGKTLLRSACHTSELAQNGRGKSLVMSLHIVIHKYFWQGWSWFGGVLEAVM